MALRDYISATERTYKYRVRVAGFISDEMMTRIERTLLKYDPLDISMPKKTMFQASPLDFTNVKNVEVHIVDLELALPASAATLVICLSEAMGLHRSHVVVRNLNDPSENETQSLDASAEMDKDACERGLSRGSVLTDPTYGEAADGVPADEMYGDRYNAKFLAYLKRVEDERNEAMRVDAPNPLFSWLDQPRDEMGLAGDFNASIDGAPAPARTGSDEAPSSVGKHGNFEDKGRSFRRVYKDETGKKVVMTRSKKA